MKSAGDIQEFFRVTDAGERERLREYLHPDVQVVLIGVEGVEEPMDRDGYLAFNEENIAFREARGERTEHVPTKQLIEGDYIAMRGYLRITSPAEPDEYHPYTDILKLRDGKIVEYNIAYDI
jgi:ketosteroid isomerase-like protein